MIGDKECLKKRKIKSCEECLRYNECKNGITGFKSETGAKRLGMEIILSMVRGFEDCWAKGYINHIYAYKQTFYGTYVTVLSNEEFDGLPIYEGLVTQCTKKYGSIESTNRAMIKEVKEKIDKLVEKRKKVTSKKEKFEITNKINMLKGELNY